MKQISSANSGQNSIKVRLNRIQVIVEINGEIVGPTLWKQIASVVINSSMCHIVSLTVLSSCESTGIIICTYKCSILYNLCKNLIVVQTIASRFAYRSHAKSVLDVTITKRHICYFRVISR